MTMGDMKQRCVEAIETMLASIARVGPSTKSGFWPEIVREKGKDYAPEDTRVRRLPTAKEIAQADEFTSWVNALDSESDRKDLWQWAYLKVKPHRTIRGYCEKLGLKEHEYRRQIDKIFQKLAQNAGIKLEMRQISPVDANSFQGQKRSSSQKSRHTWMADNAKPIHDPDSKDHNRLIRRLLDKQRQRDRA